MTGLAHTLNFLTRTQSKEESIRWASAVALSAMQHCQAFRQLLSGCLLKMTETAFPEAYERGPVPPQVGLSHAVMHDS